jgi:hypothetical protein
MIFLKPPPLSRAGGGKYLREDGAGEDGAERTVGTGESGVGVGVVVMVGVVVVTADGSDLARAGFSAAAAFENKYIN